MLTLQELVTRYVAVLRRIMGSLGVLVLVLAALRYRDPTQDSLLVLAQLRDTQHSLQLALTHTGHVKFYLYSPFRTHKGNPMCLT